MKNVKIFAINLELQAVRQIDELMEQPAFRDSKVRIMPDAHQGIGCVIGFTSDVRDVVIPNIVGVDIGCGLLVVELGHTPVDVRRLDEVIRSNIPSGFDTHPRPVADCPRLQELRCLPAMTNRERIVRSIGTLGGGNHFIEIDVDDENRHYLVIHSGSRNLGKQVAEHYQALAYDLLRAEAGKGAPKGKAKKAAKPSVPRDLAWLTGKHMADYLHDMRICQEYAVLNRRIMADMILREMGWEEDYPSFESIHNYIDMDDMIVRKGAIDASRGKRLIIPINMRDGCIIATGLGNDDWNRSAPHGAGRIMSRRQAFDSLDMEAYRQTMKDVYTTTVQPETLDEAPMAYRPMEEILSTIGDTVKVERIIKPIYNFKAAEDGGPRRRRRQRKR